MTDSVADLVSAAAARLQAAGVPNPRADAESLTCSALGWTRTHLAVERGAPAPDGAAATLDAMVRRREAREPLQLILGSVGFRYLDVEVRPGVFIPRPETEVLAGLAVERTPVGGVVVEPCTGTGAVACAVATEARPAAVVATDLSPEAVRLARHNAHQNGADITVLHGDLLAPVAAELRGRVDVLVCNPPYIAAAEMADVDPEVRWDPIEALVSGPTGNEVVDELIAVAPAWLRPDGWLLLEVDVSRARSTAERMAAAGYAECSVVADLTGRDRVVMGRRHGPGLSDAAGSGEASPTSTKENR